jgi:hypothetical protein
MNKPNFIISLVLALGIMLGQVGSAFAAPALQESDLLTGTVKSITLESDPNTGITIVSVELKCTDQTKQTLRISQATAVAIGLVTLDGDGNPVINKSALGRPVEIDPGTIIPAQQDERNPVGNALATFFSDVPGMDYDTIMAAHNKGVSFGMIGQALWLTKQLKGDSEVFAKLLTARATGDYSAFNFEGTTPQNWGQLRKAILDGKKVDKPGNTVSNQNSGNNGNGNGNGNNGNGNGNGGGNGNNGNGNGNGNNGNGNGNGGGNGNGNNGNGNDKDKGK